jgi:cell filamentation protein
MIDETRIDQCFTPDYLRRMHRVWLGEIYVWAGEYRQVNMAKGSFMFAAANQVPKLMHEFGRGALRDYTSCRFEDEGELATSLPVVHAEFILIHPFREGNGRCGRLLAILMGLQAGYRRWTSAEYAARRRVNTSQPSTLLWVGTMRR